MPAPDDHAYLYAPRPLMLDAQLASLVALLQEEARPDLETLVGLWHGHVEEQWALQPELYRLLGVRLAERGSPLLAHDVVLEGLKHWKGDLRLRQLQALALARSGATRLANAVLEGLRAEGNRDEETLGILARTHKDLAQQADDPGERRRQLARAHEVYLEAFRLTGGSYSGVNAATTALLLGEGPLAEALARQTRAAALAELDAQRRGGADGYYQLATLGETALLLGDEREAERWYREAADVGQERLGDLSSTRRQARLIARITGRGSDLVEALLPIPRVVVFTGHMMDRGDRPTPRFPLGAEPAVAEAIASRLRRLNAGFGYASAACGSDILFLEAMHALQGKTVVVLPYAIEQFAEDSVSFAAGSDWPARYARVLADAGRDVKIATARRFASGGAFSEYANSLLLGLAALQSRALDTDLIPMTVWDGTAGDGAGGTGSTVERWRRLGYQVEVIDLREIARPWLAAGSPRAPTDEDSSRSTPVRNEPWVRTMAVLFADVVHFSAMSDLEIPLFVEHFLGEVANLTRRSPHAPLVGNTWGDGLYFVFANVRDAGMFAVALCDMVSEKDWADWGLPPNLSLRVALHAGPLFSCTDPVTGLPNYTGKHVVPAARIEPVTPPGLVYATEEFAALAAAECVPEFACDPVGRLGLAKGAGTVPVYMVTPRTGQGRRS